MEHNRISWIQALRGIAATMVILFHIDAAARLLNPTLPITAPFKYFGYGGVNLFFVISGFIMVYITYDHWGERRKWGNFIARRMIRVYPTYWAVYLGTIRTVYGGKAFYGVMHGDPCFNGDIAKIVGSFVLIRDPGDMCYVPQAWTLHWEIWFYLIFSGTLFLSRKAALAFGILWLAISAAVAIFGRSHVSNWTFIWCVFNLHFLAGAGLCLLYRRRWIKSSHSSICVLAGLLWLAVSAWLNSTGAMDTENVMHRLVQFVPASMLIMYGVLGFELRSVRPPSWLIFLGDASYSIYLTHLTTFLVIRRLTEHVPHDPIHHLAWVTEMFAGAMVVGLLFYWFVERPLLHWSKVGLKHVRSSMPSAKQAA